LRTVRDGKRKVSRLRMGADKGHRGQWETFAAIISRGGPSSISFHEILNSTLATFAVVETSLNGCWIEVDTERFLADVLPAAESES
jgi:hypothetical protein